MPRLDRDKPMPEWEAESHCKRALASATFLLIAGFITDAERERIHKRMMKAYGLPYQKVTHAD